MLKTCINFADQHHLSFNADKTQLIKFYKSPNPVSASPCFIFLGQTLSLSNSISHLGHILTYNLSDDDDICAISKDMRCKANCLLNTFSCCDPFVKTRLFSSFCLSLYGAYLWRSSSPQLRALEVSFNNILRKIWSLPRHSHTGIVHTGIVHSVARLESIYNIVVIRSRSLLASARRSKCALISDLFSECAQSAYTALGYNNLFGGKHLKCYTVDDELCAALYGMHIVTLTLISIWTMTFIVFLLFELTLSLSLLINFYACIQWRSQARAW